MVLTYKWLPYINHCTFNQLLQSTHNKLSPLGNPYSDFVSQNYALLAKIFSKAMGTVSIVTNG